jgi:CRISPR/Cas system Type II protein with McrA/HNH and RuvC-like nuclease domain
MKESILKLRSEGKTYNEIKKILGCSKSTISFHCGEGQKLKNKERLKNNRKKQTYIIKRKIERFANSKINDFRNRTNSYSKQMGYSSVFSYDSAHRKIMKNPICYLTGKKIDLYMPSTYQLDHIIPQSKGGKNTLRNMGLLLSEVNFAKGNLLVEDFIKLCVEVCEYNGYNVVKKNI